MIQGRSASWVTTAMIGLLLLSNVEAAIAAESSQLVAAVSGSSVTLNWQANGSESQIEAGAAPGLSNLAIVGINSIGRTFVATAHVSRSQHSAFFLQTWASNARKDPFMSPSVAGPVRMAMSYLRARHTTIARPAPANRPGRDHA